MAYEELLVVSATPGWYPDPADPTQAIYWDGQQWTGQRRPINPTPLPAAPTPPVLPTRPAAAAAMAPNPTQPRATNPAPSSGPEKANDDEETIIRWQYVDENAGKTPLKIWVMAGGLVLAALAVVFFMVIPTVTGDRSPTPVATSSAQPTGAPTLPPVTPPADPTASLPPVGPVDMNTGPVEMDPVAPQPTAPVVPVVPDGDVPWEDYAGTAYAKEVVDAAATAGDCPTLASIAAQAAADNATVLASTGHDNSALLGYIGAIGRSAGCVN